MSAPHFKFNAAVYLIAKNEKGEVLLARRYNTGWMDGMYTLPAGHMDGNETVQVAMARETKEETDLDILPEHLKVVHVLHRKSIGSTPEHDREYIDFFLEASKWGGEPKNTEPDKCDDLGWFSLDDIPENTLEHVTVVLDKIQKGEHFSSFGL